MWVWARGTAMAAIIAPLCAMGAAAQDSLITLELDETLVFSDGGSNFGIDLNADDIDDFTVKLTLRPAQADADGVVVNSPSGVSEIAYILANGTDNPLLPTVLIDTTLSGGADFLGIFADGDTIGPGALTSDVVEADSGVFHFSTPPGKEGPGESFGPFAEIGSTGFIGLSLFNPDTDETNFGFLEVTRGSLLLGTLGFQTAPDQGAQIGEASGDMGAVPLPAPLALLGFGLIALFSLRRRA